MVGDRHMVWVYMKVISKLFCELNKIHQLDNKPSINLYQCYFVPVTRPFDSWNLLPHGFSGSRRCHGSGRSRGACITGLGD